MTHIPEPVRRWLSERGYGEVLFTQAVGGGCINNGTRLNCSRGGSFFLKTNPGAPAQMFVREAEGLQALTVIGGPRLPIPYLAGEDFLLLEDLQPAARTHDYWQVFGRQLATLHQHTHTSFGFPHDNYIGSTPQPNKWSENGYAFFAQHRLIFQAERATRSGLLSGPELRQVERLAERLPDLVPDQPASLIHGDLWGGNAISDEAGRPALIDPASHYGWAEAELAMTALFGSFPDLFYREYGEARSLEAGYRSRFPIYNLYHLLNHLNLFGAGYLNQVQAVLRRHS